MSDNIIRGIDLHDSLRLVNPKPVDVWSGPYESVDMANESIPIAIRYPSMIVRIVGEGGAFLYWYKDGVEDENLVQYLHEDFEEVNNKYNELATDLDEKYNELTNKSGDSYYEELVSMPSKIWVITHNLNKYPSVTVINNNNQVVIGDITYTDKNNLTVSFSAGFSGKVICN